MSEKKYGSFLIVWVGQFISNIGSGLTAFALGIYAFQKTQSATSFSLIILFAFLPSFILRPIGGTLADRLSRKLLMIIGDSGSALGLIFILIMMYSGFNDMWVIYLGSALSSVFVALQIPAYKSSVTDLLDKDSYSKASGLMQLAESSRYLISPIIAGFLINIIDIKNILIIDILTFVVAIAFVFLIKGNLKVNVINNGKHFFSDLIDGFKYIVSNKGILVLLCLLSLVTFAIGYFQSLLGPMILSFTNSETLGIIQTLAASGMLLTSLLLGVFRMTKKLVFIVTLAMFLAGLFYAILGISTNIVFIIIAGFFFFCTLPFINTGFDVLIRENVENEIQGRVWSIVSNISQFGMVIAFGTAGFLADYIFNPLLRTDGILAPTIGRIIGTGQGRGIGFMFIIFGTFVAIIAIVINRIKVIRSLEKE
jgi:MFS transporter, DHA3 family, macrolide efflux protein